jgi:hypothetical protein
MGQIEGLYRVKYANKAVDVTAILLSIAIVARELSARVICPEQLA